MKEKVHRKGDFKKVKEEGKEGIKPRFHLGSQAQKINGG